MLSYLMTVLSPGGEFPALITKYSIVIPLIYIQIYFIYLKEYRLAAPASDGRPTQEVCDRLAAEYAAADDRTLLQV